MAFDVKTYSPSDVIITFGGASVSGWEKITITRTIPSFKMVEGIRGKNTRIKLNNSAATVDIELTQTSDMNSVFSQIVAQDERTGTGRIEITIRDVMGGEIFSSMQGYLEAPATKTYEGEISSRTWKLVCLSSSSEQGSGWSLGSLVDKVTSLFD